MENIIFIIVIVSGLFGLVCLIGGGLFTYTKYKQSRAQLISKINVVENELQEDIQQTDILELGKTKAGRELLKLIEHNASQSNLQNKSRIENIRKKKGDNFPLHRRSFSMVAGFLGLLLAFGTIVFTLAQNNRFGPEPITTAGFPPTMAGPQSTPVTAAHAKDFFVEEFGESLSNDWSVLTVTGSGDADPDKVTVEAQDGKLIWDFDSEYVHYYLFYEVFIYEDVKVDVRVANQSRNHNNISLICRYDPDVGWYEFSIANNGLYYIYYAEVTSSGEISYIIIASGASSAIKQGKEVNEYSISCNGDELSLTIGGNEVIGISENNYGLREGQVGVSVSSFDVLPIRIEMDRIKISEP